MANWPWRFWRTPASSAHRLFLRTFFAPSRAGGSTRRASRIIGSLEPSIAERPPLANFLRKATSFSRVPSTSSSARACGDLPCSVFCDPFVIGAGLFHEHAQRIGEFRDFQIVVNRRFREQLLAPAIRGRHCRYSRNRSALSFVSSSAIRTSVRAIDEQLAVERRAIFQQRPISIDFIPLVDRLGNFVPCLERSPSAWRLWQLPREALSHLSVFGP